ncbi:hypothetical protein LguiA_034848 [Lonicera macranthoides]
MNRSFRAPERGVQASVKQRPQLGRVKTSVMKEKEEELALFLEMRKREKERNNNLLHNSEEFDAPLGLTTGSSPIFNIETATPVRKNGADDFLNSENDKNDYEWLLTPPGTPLFPSLERESPKTVRSQDGSPKAHPTALKSRLANSQPAATARNNLGPRRSPGSSPPLNNSSTVTRRPSSSGGPGSRSITPSMHAALTKSKSTPKPTPSPAHKSSPSTTPKPTTSTECRPRPVRSSTPTPRSAMPSAKSTLPARSSTPTPRSTMPSSTKSTLPARSSTPSVRSSARSSTPIARPSVPVSKPTVRAPTPIRRPTPLSTATNTSAPPIRSPSGPKSVYSMARNSVPSPASSPKVKPRPWKPSEMPGYSLDAPPNLRTSLPERPLSATRGRAGAPSARSSSVEPFSNGRMRRQSCSPSRGRAPNVSGGSSVPALSRAQAKAKDNMSPVLYGTRMVERVMNMRKLVPPKQDDKHSPHSNLSAKSSSPDSAGFGRNLSKKSLDMAMRHMDIRQRIPGNLRPLMTNIPASSMYSVRLGPTQSRPVSVSESPHAISSNASSEMSVNNSALCFNGSQVDDDINSEKGVRSPAGMQGR